MSYCIGVNDLRPEFLSDIIDHLDIRDPMTERYIRMVFKREHMAKDVASIRVIEDYENGTTVYRVAGWNRRNYRVGEFEVEEIRTAKEFVSGFDICGSQDIDIADVVSLV